MLSCQKYNAQKSMGDKMKVGITGHGFVGNALHSLFVDAVIYDKYKKIGYPQVLDDCDFVFLCLPTLLDEKTRTFDYSAIYEVLDNLGSKPLVIVKSTVTPGTCRMLKEKYNRDIVYNPEFLREATAVEDMLSATHIVVGCDNDELNDKVWDLYISQNWMGNCYETDWETAELLKLTKNAYLATKVSFFNTIYDYCQKIGVNYDNFKYIFNEDKLISNSDIFVTEQRGFGGHCLPKDLNALITAMVATGLDKQVLEEVWQYNTRIRKPDESI